MSSDFYNIYIVPYAAIIIKICRAYTNTQEDFEDYYQEVCLQIWRSRKNFKAEAEWSTWIYKLSLNVCLTLLKKDKKLQQHFVSDTLVADIPIEVEPMYTNEDLNRLYNAIKRLSEIDRAVILLYLENKPYKEIASILNTNPNNIAVRIKRIKGRLKKLLNHH